ncbi:BTAD domain-containing putative transcriptional regulator [Streptomyces sp. NPDC015131]|uniref:AfsR/SARP family transcriptional regulator n=1 Tax=Streptomyces sp. NPDC015131 TaxID=3364941 RepID=UPI00370046E3
MEFLVLGPVEARTSGRPVRLAGMRRRRLLALLLLHARRTVSVDTLVDELWQDPPASARHQVHNAVRDLRAALPPAGDGAGLVSTDIGYRLDLPPGALDVHRFTEWTRAARAARREGRDAEAARLLQEALDLWRGDAFAGIDCPAVTAAAAGLDEQRLTAVEELMELRLAAGEAGSLVAELSALTARHPLRDGLRGSLMLALYRSGRQADALAVYDEGRRLLAGELGLDPGPRLRRLHGEILGHGPRAQHQERPPAAGTTRPRPGHGNHLPRDLPDFTGRAAELALLERAADDQPPGTPRTVTVDGMGGIGKTALAVHFAHRRTADHPGGQFYLDLHGHSAARPPLTPDEALGILLASDGVAPGDLPAGPDARGAVWRSRLAGRRALLVLDDAADAAQIAPLLPGAGETLTLITTRHRPAAPDGSRALPLGALPPADAETLFRRVAGGTRTGTPLTETLALCDHHPLALRLAAGRLRDRPAWTVPDLAERLRTPAGRTALLRTADRDLMALLALSHHRLPPAARAFHRTLALHPSPVHDIPGACAATGLAAPDAERLFDTLIDHNLAHEPRPGRLVIPPLLRDCVHSTAPPAPGAVRHLTAVA